MATARGLPLPPQGVDIHMQHHLAALAAFQALELRMLVGSGEEVLRYLRQGIGPGVFQQFLVAGRFLFFNSPGKRLRGVVFSGILPVLPQLLLLFGLHRCGNRLDRLYH